MLDRQQMDGRYRSRKRKEGWKVTSKVSKEVYQHTKESENRGSPKRKDAYTSKSREARIV